jgi:SAM-dependent methyltransferase
VAGRPDGRGEAAEACDVEYAAGRYRDEPPLPFVADILSAAEEHDLLGAEGLYVGCGNGRNYLPLVRGQLDLLGLDVSATALAQLAARAPDRRDRLIHGDLSALPEGATYPLVVGIQVFQHGNRAIAHDHVRAAQGRLAPGGLFCLRVNAVGTEIEYDHDVVENDPGGSFTIRYLKGPKRGLQIHFFAASELEALFDGYDLVLPPRPVRTWRVPLRADSGPSGRRSGAGRGSGRLPVPRLITPGARSSA